MKFLTIAKLKDAASMLPPATFVSIFEASLAAWEQQKKEGKIVEAYYLPETRRLMVILNYDNADQWAKDQTKLPILNYVEVETAGALSNYDEFLKATLEAAKAAAKMMAGATK